MPPILVDIQYVADSNFLRRVVQYCEKIVAAYGVPPVVFVIVIHECKRDIMTKATKIKSKPFFFKLPCYPWANQCFILSKESISRHINKTPLDPIVALGSFFIEQKQSLAEHAHHNDPTIQKLYSIVKHIIQNQVTKEESKADFFLRIIEDQESRFQKTIGMIEEGLPDTSARKRTIDYLEEGIIQLRTCRRRYASSRSSSPIPLSTNSSANGSRESSPVASSSKPTRASSVLRTALSNSETTG